MKTARAQSGRRISFAGVESWVRAVRLRLFTRDGSPSIDGLDAAIRGFGVAIVLLLSAFGPGSTVGGTTAYLVDPLPVAIQGATQLPPVRSPRMPGSILGDFRHKRACDAPLRFNFRSTPFGGW